MKKNILIIMLLGLVVTLVIINSTKTEQIEELKQYKAIIDEINGQSYFTDEKGLEDNKFYTIYFNYELGLNGWWELYIAE